MNGINEAVIMGHLGADPDVKVFQDGGKIVTLSIATGESWNDKDGNKQERTEWHRVVLRNKLADVAEKWLKKGAHIYVVGPMKTRKYTDSNNIERYTTEVVGLTLRMLDGKQNTQQENQYDNNQQSGGYNNQMNNQQSQNNGQQYNQQGQQNNQQSQNNGQQYNQQGQQNNQQSQNNGQQYNQQGQQNNQQPQNNGQQQQQQGQQNNQQPQNNGQQYNQASNQSAPAQNNASPVLSDTEDDIPF